MDLRAYINPPWRAEEWFVQSEFVALPPGTTLTNIPVAIRGGAVPTGYRGVVKSAKIVIVQLDNIDPTIGSPFEDFAGSPTGFAIVWSLRRNGLPIPGHQNRPTCWRATQEFTNDPLRGTKSVQAVFDVDIVVPVQLATGDLLAFDLRNVSGSTQFQICAFFQGWIFPVLQDMDSAQSCAADPWGQ